VALPVSLQAVRYSFSNSKKQFLTARLQQEFDPSKLGITQQRLQQVAADNLSRALAATGNTLDDYRDPDKRRAFHASFGALAVGGSAAAMFELLAQLCYSHQPILQLLLVLGSTHRFEVQLYQVTDHCPK
jgi:hypothetical protein